MPPQDRSGAMGLTSPRNSLTAGAFRASGTIQIISFAFRICLTDMEMVGAGLPKYLRPSLANLLAAAGFIEFDDEI